MAQTLSGPSHPPAAGGAPRQLVVFLHGYGADGADLIGLAPFFAQALPHAEFLAPNAPERCAMGAGYQWFGLTNLDPALMRDGIGRSAPILDAYIDGALAARGLTTAELGLIGFSQGTMMALDRVLRHATPAKAVVGFSGMAANPAAKPPAQTHPPSVLLVHGAADPVVPFHRLAEAQAALQRAGIPVESVARPGLGHGIDQDGAARAAGFLAHHLGAAAPA
jgi:phospholipase/carboxylesterase